ncbi:MAG: DUF423 domain-containing protein [Bacteroidetes bacterium]|nr:DUF423 domain-containing protein [Bacteroidota bacterium]
MHRKILIGGLIFSLIAVLLGAFGAHTLKTYVLTDRVTIFETGVRYQFIHAMALIALSIYGSQNQAAMGEQKWLGWAAHFFIIGIFCFSGSLYLLVLTTIFNISWASFLGPITPIGGLFFMLGWMSWLRVVFKHKVDK